jgi:adenylate kinase family enzyme
MIMGAPGSGKSTLVRWLGAQTDLPVFHLDHIHHLAGWQPRPLAEKIAMAQAVEAQETWIFEGGLSSTYRNRAQRADTLIWLDLPIGLRFGRVNKRLIMGYGKSRPDVAAGCVEKFSRETLAFWKWIWDTRHSQKAKIEAIVTEFPHLTVYHLTSRHTVDDFYDEMRKTKV